MKTSHEIAAQKSQIQLWIISTGGFTNQVLDYDKSNKEMIFIVRIMKGLMPFFDFMGEIMIFLYLIDRE